MNRLIAAGTAEDVSRGKEPHVSISSAEIAGRKAGPLRVALLTNEIPPYRVPLYQTLARTPGWEFTVFTCTDRERNRQWAVTEPKGFSHKQSCSLSYVRKEQYEGRTRFTETTEIHVPIGVLGDLWRYRPDVVFSLEMGARSLLAATYARLTRKRLVLYFEGTSHTERNISATQHALRRLLRRACHAIACNGSEGRQYLEHLGVPAARIFEVGQATDTEPFQLPPSLKARDALRQQLGVQGWCCLFSGQLISRKGIRPLLDAWNLFCRKEPVEATLLLVGDGPLRAELERYTTECRLQNVRFLGFVQREALPAIYHAADMFVFPTLHDCWALVVGEAMAAGLPVIDSKYNGGAVELIQEGVNGWIADPLNTEELAEKLRLAWQCRDQKETMGKAAQAAVARISIAAVAERIRRAVQYAADGQSVSETPPVQTEDISG